MAFFWRHKFLTLFIIFLAFYLHSNPSGHFGMSRKGFVVFNRIPIALFDLYVNPKGAIAIEADLSKKANLKYWLDNHFVAKNEENQNALLLVGTGFEDGSFTLDRKMTSTLQKMNISIHQLPSVEAIGEYNRLLEEGKSVSILLRVK